MQDEARCHDAHGQANGRQDTQAAAGAPGRHVERAHRGSDAVGAGDESEQTAGSYTTIEDHLTMPFSTEVFGMEVTVERIDMTDDEEIVVVCARDRFRQRIRIVDLPLPNPPPKAPEWVDAYRRRWARRS